LEELIEPEPILKRNGLLFFAPYNLPVAGRQVGLRNANCKIVGQYASGLRVASSFAKFLILGETVR
jgi:hypothetical protein